MTHYTTLLPAGKPLRARRAEHAREQDKPHPLRNSVSDVVYNAPQWHFMATPTSEVFRL